MVDSPAPAAAPYVADDGNGVMRTYDLAGGTVTSAVDGDVVLTRSLNDAEKAWGALVVAQQQTVDTAAQVRADLLAAMPALTAAAATGDPVAVAVKRLAWLATTSLET